MPDRSASAGRGRAAPLGRTYVVTRWTCAERTVDGWRPDELTPLGTLRARTRADARAQALAAWPEEPPASLRVIRASACRPAVILGALAADGARLIGRTRP